MRQATVTIDMNNAAFAVYPLDELASILRSLADRVESGENKVTAFDSNGNAVGTLVVTGI